MSELDTVLAAADAARVPAARATAEERAGWLRAMADALDGAADQLVPIAAVETHLPDARLRGELLRTSFQARLFAQELADGRLLDLRVDRADPSWPMGPRPDIRRGFVPIGPVLVFAASNFPFAFSVAGGDTISALAVGCPVVVKTHDGHPELSIATAEVVVGALAEAGAPDGLLGAFSGLDAGVAAVQDPRIKAAGFTGSVRGGRALFDLAQRRPDPIPFYGELGSTNPVVVTAAGWRERASDIVPGFVTSFTQGAGQFCTQPGVVLVPDLRAFVDHVDVPAVHPMLNERIRDGFERSLGEVEERAGVSVVVRGQDVTGSPTPTLLATTADVVLDDPSIVRTEVFGPASVLVEYETLDEVLRVLESLDGTLTATIQGASGLDPDAATLVEAMSRSAGRVIYNEWPTGVTVSDAQQHGGPWPATTAPTSTSVGTAAAVRFARPVAYQNLPQAILPVELRG